MILFLVKRFLQAIIVMLVISIISFSIQGHLGDPLRELVGQSVSEAEREKLRQELGLKDPFLVQYTRFIKKALQGDFGVSYFFKEPALEVILRKMPATIELAFSASIIIIALSLFFGVFTAARPHSIVTKFILSFSLLGISVPVFLTAIFLIFVFSIHLGWLPSFGRGDVIELFGFWETNFLTWDGLLHIVLPAIALSSTSLPLFIRLIRSEMFESLQSEYIRFARAKGLKPNRILFVHALKNTLLPVITVGGLQIGNMIAYTLLTETVFQWPGMGFLFLEAVHRSDTPLITAYLIVVGLIFVVTNTLVDLIYGIVNPTVNIFHQSQKQT